MKNHLKNGLVVLSGQVASALGSLISVRVLTEYLTPAEYGNLTLGLTLALMVNQLFTGPLGAGITRFYSIATDNNEIEIFFLAIAKFIFLIIGIVLFTATMTITILWVTNINGWFIIIAIAAVFSVVSGLNAIINGLWLGNNQQLLLSVNQGLEPWVRILSGVLAIHYIKTSGEVVFGGFVLGVSALLLSQLYFLKRYGLLSGFTHKLARIRSDCNIEWQSKIFKFSYPFTIWGIFTTVHMASDRWILQWHYGPVEVGYFIVLYQIGYMPMSLLTSMGAQILTPVLYRLAGDGSDSTKNSKVCLATTRIVFTGIPIVIGTVLVTWILSESIFNHVVSLNYRHLHAYLPLFVIAGGLFGLGQLAAIQLQSLNKTFNLLKIKIVSASIGVFLNILLGLRYGAAGIGLSLFLSSIIYVTWLIVPLKSNR